MTVDDLKNEVVGIAVSGGLDSCTATSYLVEKGIDVRCYVADLGQPDEPDLEVVKDRMLACGAAAAHVVPAQAEIAAAGIKVLQAQAVYEGEYWNTTGIARHVTVATLLPAMREHGVTVLSHGATGKGNDQVRFQLVTSMLDPTMKVYAPWRDPDFVARFPGRKQMIDYCDSKGIPLNAEVDPKYSTDANMLGLTHEAGDLERLTTEAMLVTPEMGVTAMAAPGEPEDFTATFAEGVPTKINGQPVTPVEAIQQANKIGGDRGIGILKHVVENRYVGIKSRGVYESPGMDLLGTCYEYLLQPVTDRRTRTLLNMLSPFIAEQIYQGYWFGPGAQAAQAAVDEIARLVTGEVTVTLYKGSVFFKSIDVLGVPHNLYYEDISTMEAKGEAVPPSEAKKAEVLGKFDHLDSEGLMRIWSLVARTLAVGRQTDVQVDLDID